MHMTSSYIVLIQDTNVVSLFSISAATDACAPVLSSYSVSLLIKAPMFVSVIK